MIHDFEYCLSTQFVFGKDAEKKAGEKLAAFGAKNVLMVYYGNDAPAIKKCIEAVKEDLHAHGMQTIELGGIKPNPILDAVYQGMQVCRDKEVDFILAIGGGSVIDTAKAIGIGMANEADVWDMFTGRAKIQAMMPVGVILTYPATGSESSWGAVITNPDGNYKVALDDAHLRPTISFMNPELTYSLPDYLTGCGVADMFVHVTERYFSPDTEFGATDYLCEAVLRALADLGPKVLNDPDHYQLRAEIMWLGSVAHNDTVGVGRIQDWASHKMGHEVSALYDTAHGATLSIVMPAWMKYVSAGHPQRFRRYAVEVFRLDPQQYTQEELTKQAIACTESFFRSLGVPVRFSEIGISSDRFSEMAEKASHAEGTDQIGHLTPLNKEDIEQIYRLAL